jgi:hypothetical protein
MVKGVTMKAYKIMRCLARKNHVLLMDKGIIFQISGPYFASIFNMYLAESLFTDGLFLMHIPTPVWIDLQREENENKAEAYYAVLRCPKHTAGCFSGLRRTMGKGPER